jgi:hypothetical protein
MVLKYIIEGGVRLSGFSLCHNGKQDLPQIYSTNEGPWTRTQAGIFKNEYFNIYLPYFLSYICPENHRKHQLTTTPH